MNTLAYRVHERTLIGGIDSYMGGLVHVRPHLAARQRDQLEAIAAQWIADGGLNELDDVTPEWINHYLAVTDEPAGAASALRDFYGWALREGLTDRSPVSL